MSGFDTPKTAGFKREQSIMTSSKLYFVVVATLLSAVSASARAAPSNEDFAAGVQRHYIVMNSDKKQVEQAEAFCQNLPQTRIETEPRCIAMQKYYSAQAREGKFKPSPPKRW